MVTIGIVLAVLAGLWILLRAVDLEIINNFTISTQGDTIDGKQGAAVDGMNDPFAFQATNGTAQKRIGTLATATVVSIYDEDSDYPTGFEYFHFWADQDCYLQFIAQATHVVHKVEAKTPFVLPGFDDILGAASTTAITGGTEPTLSKIDSIILGNYSGTTLNWKAAWIN